MRPFLASLVIFSSHSSAMRSMRSFDPMGVMMTQSTSLPCQQPAAILASRSSTGRTSNSTYGGRASAIPTSMLFPLCYVVPKKTLQDLRPGGKAPEGTAGELLVGQRVVDERMPDLELGQTGADDGGGALGVLDTVTGNDSIVNG